MSSVSPETDWHSDEWRVFGTGARLVVTEPEAIAPARAVIDDQLAAIDLAASRFRPDSEISRLNAAGGTEFEISELFASLLEVAIDAAEATDGAVDPTLGVSLREVGYDRTFGEIPEDGPPIRVTFRREASYRLIELDRDALRVRLPEWVELDLGATAKSWAADQAAAAAFTSTGAGVMLSLGGDIAFAGPAPESGWPILITEDSALPLTTPGPVVVVHSGGVATSSITSRTWRRGGESMHHLLDPWAGIPVTSHRRSVSVAANTCVEANVTATAAIVLGGRDPQWLERQGLAARAVATDGSVRCLAGWPEDPS